MSREKPEGGRSVPGLVGNRIKAVHRVGREPVQGVQRSPPCLQDSWFSIADDVAAPDTLKLKTRIDAGSSPGPSPALMSQADSGDPETEQAE
jgi:hypothetical protein